MANPYIGTNISGCSSPGLGVDKATYSSVFDVLAAALDAHDHSSNKGIQIDTAGLVDACITTNKIAAAAVDATKLATSVAGAGLAGGAGSALSVNVDGTGIEINSDTLRLKDLGVKTAKIDDLAVTTVKIADANVTLAKLATDALQMLVPVGAVLDFAGATAPTNYLFCYGQAISRTTYATLFGILGTYHGSGNGTTTFNLPDLRGRVIAGKDDMGGTTAGRIASQFDATFLGAVGGNEVHTLTPTEMPAHTHNQNSHTHTGSQAAHDHTYSRAVAGTGGADGGSGGGTLYAGLSTQNTSSVTPTVFINSAIATNTNTGGDGAHPNLQPTLILNKIIRAL